MSTRPGIRDFVPILQQMVAAGASDLHLKVGVAPTLRIDGVLYAIERGAPSRPRTWSGLLEQFLPPERRAQFARSTSSTSRSASPAWRASGSTCAASAAPIGASWRLVPTTIPTLDELYLPALLGRLRPRAARAHPGDRRDRRRQVDHARGDDRPHQPPRDAQDRHASRTRSSTSTATTSA